MANQPTPIFSVESEWCGTVILRPDRWQHAVGRHPEVEPYVEQIKLTLESPALVYQASSTKPTMRFYGRDLIDDDPRFRDCYVCAIVRSGMCPACVWTAYLPSRISANAGKLLHAAR